MSPADDEVEVQAEALLVRYQLSRRGIAVAALVGGAVLGLVGGAVAMLVPLGGLAQEIAAMQLENAGLRRDTAAQTEMKKQLASAKERAERLEQQGQRQLEATALALQEAQQMPAFKSPAYREPFAKMLAALRQAQGQGTGLDALVPISPGMVQSVAQRSAS